MCFAALQLRIIAWRTICHINKLNIFGCFRQRNNVEFPTNTHKEKSVERNWANDCNKFDWRKFASFIWIHISSLLLFKIIIKFLCCFRDFTPTLTVSAQRWCVTVSIWFSNLGTLRIRMDECEKQWIWVLKISSNKLCHRPYRTRARHNQEH